MIRRFGAGAALAVFAACAVASIPAAGAAPGNCVSWLGARDTGQCISESTGGLPQVGFNGWGVETGPLFPGQTITKPLR